jgi:hypothetical protein
MPTPAQHCMGVEFMFILFYLTTLLLPILAAKLSQSNTFILDINILISYSTTQNYEETRKLLLWHAILPSKLTVITLSKNFDRPAEAAPGKGSLSLIILSEIE